MRPYRVHVLYEHGHDGRPYSCSQIRLLRPLTHPLVVPWIDLTAGPELCGGRVDLVVADRLWREDLSVEVAERLVEDVRRSGARFMHSLDDNLMLMLAGGANSGRAEQCRLALEVFLRAADRVIVSTEPLVAAVQEYNRRVTIIPNFLDERLLPYGRLGTPDEHRRRLARWRRDPDRPLTIGYMGTFTHDGDLAVVAGALKSVSSRRPSRLNIEIVGVVGRPETWSLLQGLPYRAFSPGPLYVEYPGFMPWFCGRCSWDIALAPLANLPFNGYKSDIKFLDYAALGTAGLYSRVPVYQRTVQHGITGWLVDNSQAAWEAAIERVLARPAEVASVGWLAQRYLRQHRTLAHGAPLWLNAVRLTMAQDS